MSYTPPTPVGQAAPASSLPTVGPLDTAPGSSTITAADAASTIVTGQGNQSIITGTPTANSAATFALASVEAVRVQISGTWSATLQFEISIDGGTTYYPTPCQLTGTTLSPTAVTADCAGIVAVAGATHLRVRATALASGTATVKVVETSNTGAVAISNASQVNFSSLMTKFVSDSNGNTALTTNVSYTASLTVSGFLPVELEITNRTGTSEIFYTLDGTTPSATNFSGVLPATLCSVTLPCDGTPTLKLFTAGTGIQFAAVVRGR